MFWQQNKLPAGFQSTADGNLRAAGEYGGSLTVFVHRNRIPLLVFNIPGVYADVGLPVFTVQIGFRRKGGGGTQQRQNHCKKKCEDSFNDDAPPIAVFRVAEPALK